MTQGPLKIAIVAGESSGDNLGVDLISALKQQYPDAEFKGIAGPRMQSEGCESWYAMEELAVIGVWAILKKLRYFIQMRKELAQKISDWQADLFIGIDAPEFNLDLEGMLKRQGIPTVHYVSPSVWAWRKNRIHKIKANVDLMLTLLPFEEAIYHDHQIPVCCVGHPLAEQFAMEPDPSEAVAMLNVSPLEQTLAVLPGSRMSEIEHLGHLFLEVIAKVQEHKPNLKANIACANERIREKLQTFINGMENPPIAHLHLGKSREIMMSSSVILVASGTATLEALLCKRPMIVAYKVSALSYAIYSRLVNIKHFSLPNLLSDVPIVPELIQADATVESLEAEVNRALKYGMTPQLRHDYDRIHESLRRGGGKAAAEAISKQFFSESAA